MSDMNNITAELLWEQDMVDNGVNKYLTATDAIRYRKGKDGWSPQHDESATSYGMSLMKEVILPFEDAIKFYVDKAFRTRGKRDIAAQYMAVMDVREVAYIATKCIVDTISISANQTELTFRIAGKLEDQVRLTRFDEDYPNYFKAICEDMAMRGTKNYRHKRKVLTHCHNKAIDNAKGKGKEVREWAPWPKSDRVHLGSALIDLFIMSTGLCKRVMVKSRGKTTYVIEAEELTEDFINKNMELFQYLHPEFLPTLVPPRDWSGIDDGGYHSDELRRRRPFVKTRGWTRKAVSKAMRFAEMPGVYNAANAAQQVAWRVNKDVLEQVKAELQSDNGIGCPAGMSVPAPVSPMPLPDQGKLNDLQYKALVEGLRQTYTPDELAALSKWRGAMRDWHHRKISNKGKMLGLYNCHKVAAMLAGKERFHYVHTLDSRGRLYPVGVHLTPQGTDLSKGLLEFADGTKLGSWGYYHLCLHGAGVYGVDKVSLEDRIAWVHEHKQKIMDTWSNPADTREWWGQADKPYMFLATCLELAEIWMFNGTKMLTIVNKEGLQCVAENFESRIPCAQDGSCNGIQHFSAMLLDITGALAVNMTASSSADAPRDIYGETAALVIEMITQDLTDGMVLDGTKDRKTITPGEASILTTWLNVIGIDRKVCKRSTMIIPYGGQKSSCLADVGDILAEKLDWMDKQGKGIDWDHNERYSAAYLMHHYVWRALDTVVVAARKAMLFLNRVARAHIKTGTGLKWVTPLGFPAYQDYKDQKQIEVKTKINGRMCVKYQQATDKLNEAKMCNAFAPNFVHSMDATHLMMSVNAAYDEGIEHFGLVHDSYAAPAGHCELFHKIIRDQFIKLYSENQLYRLLLQQRTAHPEYDDKYPTMEDIEPGTYKIEEVADAPYFFR